ncbi:MAG: hypothetical protein IPK11_15655 [Ignavibacteria bacterium]|nr:hypothetical protein [Ignavibacteria bacterium]
MDILIPKIYFPDSEPCSAYQVPPQIEDSFICRYYQAVRKIYFKVGVVGNDKIPILLLGEFLSQNTTFWLLLPLKRFAFGEKQMQTLHLAHHQYFFGRDDGPTTIGNP